MDKKVSHQSRSRRVQKENCIPSNTFRDLPLVENELEARVKERTRELRDALDTLQLRAQVLATLNEGVMVATESGKIVFTNEVFATMFGYAQGELLGRHIDVLFAGNREERAHTSAIVRKALLTGREWNGRIVNTRKDETRFISQARIKTTRIAGQTYIVSLQEDVTKRDAVEVAIRKQEQLTTVGTTAMRLTHEIGNRLNGLSTSIQLLERQLRRRQSIDIGMVSETLGDLKNESDRMRKFLQDLRTLARAYRLDVLPVDLAPLLRETLHVYEPTCLRRGISIVEVFPSSVALVSVDRERCSEVLHHLLSNAIEAMPDGGTLTVKTREEQQYVSVLIHDTGRGIQGYGDVFAPFISTKPGGAGLGLTIAQQLTHAQHGTLGFTSVPDQGTTFVLQLPKTDVTIQSRTCNV